MFITYKNYGLLNEVTNYPISARWTKTGLYTVNVQFNTKEEIELSSGSGLDKAMLFFARPEMDFWEVEIELRPEGDQEKEITRALAFELWDSDNVEIMFVPWYLLKDQNTDKNDQTIVIDNTEKGG